MSALLAMMIAGNIALQVPLGLLAERSAPAHAARLRFGRCDRLPLLPISSRRR